MLDPLQPETPGPVANPATEQEPNYNADDSTCKLCHEVVEGDCPARKIDLDEFDCCAEHTGCHDQAKGYGPSAPADVLPSQGAHSTERQRDKKQQVGYQVGPRCDAKRQVRCV